MHSNYCDYVYAVCADSLIKKNCSFVQVELKNFHQCVSQLREYECGFGGLPHPSFAGYRSPSNDSMLRPNFDDGTNDSSIPLLVARGSVPQVADDSGSLTSSGHQLQPPPPRPD
jgi:hypothetical protein